MPKPSFIDFKALKAAITMEQLLEHYGLTTHFTRSGDSLSGPCPIHNGSNPTQFRINASKNIWHCFGDCRGGGNVLDFVAAKENVNIQTAARRIVDWFGLNLGTALRPNQTPKPKVSEPQPKREDDSAPNPPLKFRLEKLASEHPYPASRGLSPETIAEFGLGFCAKGMMGGRIAIPIHSAQGELLAYAGRTPNEPTAENPKYKLPPGFKKSLELFNLHRALREPADMPLVIVEGFFGCMALYEQGFPKVVALMGSSMSAEQEALLRKYAPSRIIVMLDEDEAGRSGRDDVVVRLVKFAFVKIHVFERPGMQPEDLTAAEVAAILE